MPDSLNFRRRRHVNGRKSATGALENQPSSIDSEPVVALHDSSKQPGTTRCLKASVFNRHPTFTAAALFLLIFSGPPKLRLRDPEASIRGDLDWVVILHIIVWGLAGLWVVVQLGKRLRAKRPLLRLRVPQILGVLMVLALAASVTVSPAPTLTAFKVYQMLVCMLFTQLFAERFGAWTSLTTIFWGSAILCAVIAACAFLAPDLVWGPSDFSWDPSRLRGDLIAPTGVVSAIAIILLLTRMRRFWGRSTLLFGLFLGLLILSLMRTAYLVLIVFSVLALLSGRKLKPPRQLGYLACTLALFLYMSGRLPSLGQYRNWESLSNLSDRVGLWNHLGSLTLSRAPWLGLGYYSASRIYGPEYNPGLGTAHSMFFEVLSGGGVPSLVMLVLLCLSLLVYAARLYFTRRDQFSLAVFSLFMASLLFGCMGEEIDSGPVALCFWYSAALLPILCERFVKSAPKGSLELVRTSR